MEKAIFFDRLYPQSVEELVAMARVELMATNSMTETRKKIASFLKGNIDALDVSPLYNILPNIRFLIADVREARQHRVEECLISTFLNEWGKGYYPPIPVQIIRSADNIYPPSGPVRLGPWTCVYRPCCGGSLYTGFARLEIM